MAKPLLDYKDQVTKALPAAAATNYSDSIDLFATQRSAGDAGTLGTANPRLFVIKVPVGTALVATKTMTFEVQDSADNSSFADITGRDTALTITGITGNGNAATEFQDWLPPNCRRYVRLKQVVESGGGDNTAKSVTFGIASL